MGCLPPAHPGPSERFRADAPDADRREPTTSHEVGDGGLALALAVGGALLVVYLTLFPFDLVSSGRSIGDAVDRFALTSGNVWTWRDGPANVAMLVPFGLGVGGLAVTRGWSRRSAVLTALVAGLVLSTAMEFAQAIWLLREPSLDDVAANTLGAMLGGWAWPLVAGPAVRLAGRVRLASGSGWGRAAVYGVALLPVAAVLSVIAATRDDARPSGWDPTYGLVLGNETTGDRPWSGSLSEVALADRALASPEVGSWLEGTPLTEIDPAAVVFDLDLRNGPGSGPPGGWAEVSSEPSNPPVGIQGRLPLGPDAWLRSAEPLDDVARRVDSSGAFTLVVDAASTATDQTGPARIVSISEDLRRRNVTVAQDGTDLVIRVRSDFAGADGTNPELAFPDVFIDSRPHRIAVTVDADVVSVAVDSVQRNEVLELEPETVAMVTVFPDELERIRFSTFGNVLRTIALATFTFGPWCIAVGLMRRRRRPWAVTVAMVAAPVLAVEGVLVATVQGHSFRPLHVAVVIVVALGVVGALAVRDQPGTTAL